jgi:casein kinase II subunit beta
VEESYISDSFNLYGLSNEIEDYANALRVLRDQPVERSGPRKLQKRAETLYGLIHARYILTFHGIKELEPKYDNRIYGVCPRVTCNEQPLLPIGLSPTPGEMPVKTYCPCCEDVYETDCDLDGAFFGPYCPHFFVQTLRNDVRIESKVPTPLTILGIGIEPDSEMNRSRFVHG